MTHERAAIMAITFIIGFTTGLIAYGIPQTDIPMAYVPPTSYSAAVASSRTEVVAPATSSSVNTVRAEISAGGLYLIKDTMEPQLVSVPYGRVPGLNDISYTDVYEAIPSPNGEFLFFCAAYVDTAGDCQPQIFSSADEAIYTLSGQEPVDPADVRAAWASDGRLQFNTLVSVSSEKPWMVQ